MSWFIPQCHVFVEILKCSPKWNFHLKYFAFKWCFAVVVIFFFLEGAIVSQPGQTAFSVTCHKYLSGSISYSWAVFSYFWQTLEELECHGPVMSEQTRAELEQKIDEARESIRKAEVRKKSFWHVHLRTTEWFLLQLLNFVCASVSSQHQNPGNLKRSCFLDFLRLKSLNQLNKRLKIKRIVFKKTSW